VHWDEDTLLGQSINNNEDSSKTVRGSELFDKIHGYGTPQMFWDQKRSEQPIRLVMRSF